jgi:O-antigen/teichoic acid export membrane protein
MADVETGLYTAAQSIARIPYYLLLGVSQIVFPRLSARTTGEGALAARKTCSVVLSGMCVVLAGLLAVTLPLTDEMIQIVYPARYAGGSGVLGWLLAGSAALSLAEATLTMLSGAGGPRRPAAVLAVALACQLALGGLLVPREGPAGAAKATLMAAGLATILAGALLRRLLGAGLRGRLLATSTVPLCCLAAVAYEWSRRPWPRLATVAFMVGAYGCYLAALWCLNAKELRRELAGATPLPSPM